MTKKQGYIPEFDGMRGIAIAMVMLFHLWRYTGDQVAGQVISKVSHVGWAGVDVFFVLSGFLITGILLDTRDSKHYWKSFYIRRGLRIFPLYYLVMTSLVVAVYTANALEINIQDAVVTTVDRIWINFLYLTNFARAFYGADYVPLDIAWSLAVEEQFYLVFPFIVRYASRPTLKYVLIGAIVAAPVFRYMTYIWSGSYDAPAFIGPYVLPYCRMDSLAMGGLALLLIRDSSDQLVRIIALAAYPALILAVVVLALWTREDLTFVITGYSVVAFASMAMMLRVFIGGDRFLGRVFRQRVLIYLGKISYGLYLLHLIARAIVDQFVLKGHGLPLHSDLGFAFLRFSMAAGVAILMASVSYYIFERPILSLKDRLAPARESIVRKV